ncbi:MAG: alpha-L-fucosidase, partial [Flavobacteriales bacterium]|nr:alpha-L-fucosidase [Flavobacteriales bacterium]
MIRRSDDGNARGSWLCKTVRAKRIACLALHYLIISSADHLIAQDLRWFQDANLGIFIHWGIYSVNGTDESWAFYNKKMSHADYMKQIEGFTAKNYDPEDWAELIKRSGAKYAVITTKHHDGVAMWPTAIGYSMPDMPQLVALNT